MFLTRAACILLVGRALMELMGILEGTLGFHISRLFESDPPCIARVGLFLNIIRGPSTPYARKHEPKIPTHAAAEERKVPSPTWDFYKESGTGSKQQPTSGTSATGVGGHAGNSLVKSVRSRYAAGTRAYSSDALAAHGDSERTSSRESLDYQ